MRELLPLCTDLIVKHYDKPDRLKWLIQEYWTGRSVLHCVYDYLVQIKELPKIEELEEQEKQRLKGLMKHFGTGDTDNRMVQVKCLYLVESLTNQKIEI